MCSSQGVACLGEHSWQMQLCVASCAQRCSTSPGETLLALPLGHAGMHGTSSMRSSHSAGARRQCTSSFPHAGGAWVGCSIRGAAQTAKPHMSHKLGSGVGGSNHHYPCCSTATTVQRCAQPSRDTLSLGVSLLRPFLFAKKQALSWLPACSPLQQEEREPELLKGWCEEVLGYSVRSVLQWTQDQLAEYISFTSGSKPWCSISGKDFGELKIQIFNLTFRLYCSEANLASLKLGGRQ